jgi:uroporphyrinogen III methyltransferase/synthase
VFGIDPSALYVVTRPRPDTESVCAALRARGLTAVAYPVLAIEPVADPATLAITMAAVADYGLVVFVSPNAIRQSLAHRLQPWPAQTTIGVMGPGSAATLAAAGVAARVILPAPRAGSPSGARFDSESLFARLDTELGLSRGFDRRVLILRGNGGRPWLADRLRGLGLSVDEVESYRRVTPAPDVEGSVALTRAYATDAPVAFVVTSSDAVERLLECVVVSLAAVAEGAVARDWARRGVVVTQHPRIAETAGGCGFARVLLVNPDELGTGAGIE